MVFAYFVRNATRIVCLKNMINESEINKSFEEEIIVELRKFGQILTTFIFVNDKQAKK